MINQQKICDCPTLFSIEPHGEHQVLYLGRCNHQHGYNLLTISDVAYNCNLQELLHKLNSQKE